MPGVTTRPASPSPALQAWEAPAQLCRLPDRPVRQQLHAVQLMRYRYKVQPQMNIVSQNHQASCPCMSAQCPQVLDTAWTHHDRDKKTLLVVHPAIAAQCCAQTVGLSAAAFERCSVNWCMTLPRQSHSLCPARTVRLFIAGRPFSPLPLRLLPGLQLVHIHVHWVLSTAGIFCTVLFLQHRHPLSRQIAGRGEL